MLKDTIGNFSANWMYTALVEGIFDGPQPSWSRDHWSFIPLDLSSVPSLKTKRQLKRKIDGFSFTDHYPTAYLTCKTTAVRGSI
jgi:hypothetical protein